MRISTTERILATLVVLTAAYKYATGNYPIEIEVDK